MKDRSIGRLLQARRARGLDPLQQCRHYVGRACSHTAMMILILTLAALVENISGAPYNKTSVVGNKAMNFDPLDTLGVDVLNNFTDADVSNYTHLAYETGEELDQSNSQYDERRWAFSWGVDLILRFDKGYRFCPSYVIIPAENVWPLGLRAFIYLFCLFYLFLGVAIVSDIFMSGIEEITAEKEKIVVQEEDGEQKEIAVSYTIWNETVANLTLLALGSSAPEILLAVVETMTTLDQVPGELGPSTIVGSAAFNLLCITGICMLAVEEVKKIDEFGVFLITSATSLFAYIWMLVVLQFHTPDVVDVWEGVLTLLFFPLMVLVAWLQDRNWFRPETDEGPRSEGAAAGVNFTSFNDEESRGGGNPGASECEPVTKADSGDAPSVTQTPPTPAQANPASERVAGPEGAAPSPPAEAARAERAAPLGTDGGGDADAGVGDTPAPGVAVEGAAPAAAAEEGAPTPDAAAPNGGTPAAPAAPVEQVPDPPTTPDPNADTGDVPSPPSGKPPPPPPPPPQSSGGVPVRGGPGGMATDVGVSIGSPNTAALHASPINSRKRAASHRLLDAKVSGASRQDVQALIEQAKTHRGKVTEEAIREELERKKEPKKMNKGHYRMNAIRSVITKQRQVISMMTKKKRGSETGSDAPAHEAKDPLESSQLGHSTNSAGTDAGYAEWVKNSYSVLENTPTLTVHVRRGGGCRGALVARWRTADLTAMDGTHYKGGEGVVRWDAGDEEEKAVTFTIVDNKEHNPDLIFTVKLEVVPAGEADGAESHLGRSRMTVVTIMDDDHPGVFDFSASYYCIPESKGTAELEIHRSQGCAGQIIVSYRTTDGEGNGAATAPQEYTAVDGQVCFETGETSKTIYIPIVDKSRMEREDHFFVKLTGVEGKQGGRLGSIHRTRVIIHSDQEAIGLIEEVLRRVKDTQAHRHPWAQQFRNAMDFGPSDDGARPSNLEYLMHFLTLFWKVLFSFIPPPAYGGGFPTFVCALVFIGMVTAMVAEIAGLVGCTMGLEDQVTAITFVALGTSLPDTFASKQAVEEEEFADAAVGNVTGSNSVNVFLGLGLPWTLAALYYAGKGECFIVPSGTLSFSVLVFTVLAIVCLGCLLGLRVTQGGEIGGRYRKFFAVFFCVLWFLYILLSSLNVYGHLGEFPGTQNRCPCACSNRGILPWAREPASVPGSCIAAGCPLP